RRTGPAATPYRSRGSASRSGNEPRRKRRQPQTGLPALRPGSHLRLAKPEKAGRKLGGFRENSCPCNKGGIPAAIREMTAGKALGHNLAHPPRVDADLDLLSHPAGGRSPSPARQRAASQVERYIRKKAGFASWPF